MSLCKLVNLAGKLARPMHVEVAFVGAPGSRLGVRPRPLLGERLGSVHSALRLPVPSAHAIAKRPIRVIIAAAVFAFGMLAGAGIAAWLVPPV
jgi:hypothetical protein